jgi:hypothetical protein
MFPTRYVALAVIALVVAGVLALEHERQAEAEFDDLETIPATGGVIRSGDTVTAFATTTDGPNDPGLVVQRLTIGGVIAASTENETCSIDPSEDTCNPGSVACPDPIVFDPDQPDFETVTCLRWAADQGGATGDDALTIAWTFTVECTEAAIFQVLGGHFVVSEDDDFEVIETAEFICAPAEVPGVFLVTKQFDGDPEQEFEFTFDSSLGLCAVQAPDGSGGFGPPPFVFTLADGQTAIIQCILFETQPATMTVTETAPDSGVATITQINCGESDAEGDLESGSAQLTLAVQDNEVVGSGDCTFVNTAPVVPDPPSLTVSKLCIGDPGGATFEVSVGLDGEEPLDSQPVACGGEVVFPDLAPGTHEVSETIAGAEGDVVTLIGCDGVPVAMGTSISLPLALGADAGCTIINIFGLDEEEAADLICPVCLCACGLDLEIDIANENTNVIGIENENDNKNANENTNNNANTNTNTNTQDQTNDQSQDNTNEQTNNIDSSPEVNINFD